MADSHFFKGSTIKNTITITSSAIPAVTIVAGVNNIVNITNLATNITSLTSGLTGTPRDGDMLCYRITAASGTYTLTPGALFEDTSFTAPTTITTATQGILYMYNSTVSKYQCVGTYQT